MCTYGVYVVDYYGGAVRPSWPGAALVLLMVLAGGCAEQAGGASVEPSPSAMADFVHVRSGGPDAESLADLGLTVEPLPDREPVATSRFVWHLRELAVTGELAPSQREALGLAPGPGETDGPLRPGPRHELLVAWIDHLEGAPRQSGSSLLAELQVDGETRQLERLASELPGVVVASVPAGVDAVLTVTDDRAQTRALSLRTGRLVEGANHPADLLASGEVEIADDFRVEGVTPTGYAERARCEVRLTPTSYHADEGEAPPGRMWLAVRVELSFPRGTSGHVYENAQIEVDLADSLTILADGEALPLPATTVTVRPEPGVITGEVVGEWSGYVEVADSARSFEVTFRLAATFSRQESGGTLSYQRFDSADNTAEVTLAPYG